MISKIQPEGNLTLTYQCESALQFEGKKEQIEFFQKKYFNLQQAQVKCLLQVITYTKKQPQGNGRSPFEVTYNCDSSAKTLQQILQDQLKEEQKILYFCKLIELAWILKKQQIIHLNIKLCNVIWNLNKFYVIDFGYFNTSPSSFVINQNFGQYAQHNDNKRYLYPYLTHEFLNWVKDWLGNTEVIEKYLKTQANNKLPKIDQYALGIMMLELFVSLKNIYKNFEIQTCIEQANKKNREEQLKQIYDLQENYGRDTVENIHKIISDILFKDQLPSDQDLKLLKENFEKQQIINNQQRQNIDQFKPIDQNKNTSQLLNQSLILNENYPLILDQQQILQQKMIRQNKDYIKELIDEDTYEFDPNLLYYLNQKDLHHFSQKIDAQSQKLMFEKATNILILLSKDYLKKQNYKEFSNLSNEDKYYILQTYLNGNNQINDQVKEQIQQLNQIKEDQFKFNQINKELTKKNYLQQVTSYQNLQEEISSLKEQVQIQKDQIKLNDMVIKKQYFTIQQLTTENQQFKLSLGSDNDLAKQKTLIKQLQNELTDKNNQIQQFSKIQDKIKSLDEHNVQMLSKIKSDLIFQNKELLKLLNHVQSMNQIAILSLQHQKLPIDLLSKYKQYELFIEGSQINQKVEVFELTKDNQELLQKIQDNIKKTFEKISQHLNEGFSLLSKH